MDLKGQFGTSRDGQATNEDLSRTMLSPDHRASGKVQARRARSNAPPTVLAACIVVELVLERYFLTVAASTTIGPV